MFVVFHDATKPDGPPYAVAADLVQNVHVEADGGVRVVVAWGLTDTYSLDVTESFADVVAALNA